MGSRLATLVLLAVVFLSGASALIFETLLFRLAGLTLGNSVWAVSIVLASFMTGLAIGNYYMIRRGDRIRHPVRAYAGLELAIGVSGLSLVLLSGVFQAALAPLFGALGDWPWLVNTVRLIVSFVMMLAPAAAMGMTLPVLVGALSRTESDFGSALGKLYGLNTLGAVLGALAAEQIFVEQLGVIGSGVAAAAFNFLAAGGAFVVFRAHSQSQAPAPHGEEVAAAAVPSAARRLLFAAALLGGALLALEVVWFRFFLMFLDAYGSNLAGMLAIVLAGIGIGGLIASVWFRFQPSAGRHVTSTILLAGVTVGVVYRLFIALLTVETAGSFVGQLLLMLPVSILSGVMFTLVAQAIKQLGGSAVRATGQVTLFNTLGAAAGSLVGGFVLVPFVGTEQSFFLITVLYGIAALLTYKTVAMPSRVPVAVAATLWTLAAAVFPHGAMQESPLQIGAGGYALASNGDQLLLYREGRTETLQYYGKFINGELWRHQLVTNNHNMSAVDLTALRYMKMYTYLPMAVAPDAKDALLISYGVGSTAKSLTDTKSLSSIDIVDISRDILDANLEFRPPPEDHPLFDKRVNVRIEDGRFHLQTTKKSYDIITAEPPPPRFSGISNLYSQEFFELARDRLRDGGIVTYWLPIHQLTESESKAVLAGFCEAFPNCSVWTAVGLEWMMVGVKGDRKPPSDVAFSAQWKDPVVGAEMRRLGLMAPEQLGSLFIADGQRLRDFIGDAPALVDNYPQRIRSRTIQVPRKTVDDYIAFTRAPESAGNFANSPLIAQLWPASLRAATAPYFRVRNSVNKAAFGAPNAELLHETLTNPLLAGYSLWVLQSDAFASEIVRQIPAADIASGQLEPEVYEHLAADAVSRGAFRQGAEYLNLARISGRRLKKTSKYPRIFWDKIEIYLLLRGGERAKAQRLAARVASSAPDPQALRAFFAWAEAQTAPVENAPAANAPTPADQQTLAPL